MGLKEFEFIDKAVDILDGMTPMPVSYTHLTLPTT